jgi:hypothetical protein
MGMFFASVQRATAHHNLLAHNRARNPQFSRETWGEAINNIVYNYGTFGAEIQSGAQVSLIGNYFKTGDNWTGVFNGIRVDEPDAGYPDCAVYVLGNVGPGRPTDTGNQWNAVTGDDQYRVFSPPFTPSGVTSTTALEAYDEVLAGAGSFPRDAVDTRVISDVINGTGAAIESQDDVGGWPALGPGSSPLDSDNDGMPNDWEIANGLNPNSGSDGNGDLDGDGYTNIEEYINGLILTGIVGEPPVLSDIVNQTISGNARFASLRIDDLVTDPDDLDSDMTWSWTGNSELTITLDETRRGIRVRRAANWTGTETVTFTVTDPDGNSDSDVASFTATTIESVGGESETGFLKMESSLPQELPRETGVLGNYPNPFNPATNIRFALAGDSWVELKVYNTMGQEVATLVNGFRSAGYHSVSWNGTTDSGSLTASGVYLYRLNAGDVVKTGRMIFTK